MTDENTQTKAPRKRASKAKEAKAESTEPTEYIVLERVEVRPATKITDVFDVPEGIEPNAFTADLWRPIGRTTVNGSEKKIIDSVVDERPGTYKAVAARAWKGGETKAQTTIVASTPLEG